MADDPFEIGLAPRDLLASPGSRCFDCSLDVSVGENAAQVDVRIARIAEQRQELSREILVDVAVTVHDGRRQLDLLAKPLAGQLKDEEKPLAAGDPGIGERDLSRGQQSLRLSRIENGGSHDRMMDREELQLAIQHRPLRVEGEHAALTELQPCDQAVVELRSILVAIVGVVEEGDELWILGIAQLEYDSVVTLRNESELREPSAEELLNEVLQLGGGDVALAFAECR